MGQHPVQEHRGRDDDAHALLLRQRQHLRLERLVGQVVRDLEAVS